MPSLSRPLIVALILGPAGYALAGHKRRAIASAGLGACLLLLVAYLPYLEVFSALNLGGDSARELFDTAVAATGAWLAAAPTWAPWELAALAVVNAICAVDMAFFTRRAPSAADAL